MAPHSFGHAGAKIAQLVEAERVAKKKHARMAAMEGLLAQIKANEEAKRTVTMSDTEKQVNISVLEQIPNSQIVLPPRGIVTYRQAPGTLEKAMVEREQKMAQRSGGPK